MNTAKIATDWRFLSRRDYRLRRIFGCANSLAAFVLSHSTHKRSFAFPRHDLLPQIGIPEQGRVTSTTMGKRKSSKKPQSTKKGPAPLDKTFRCLFCQHPGTVTCKLSVVRPQAELPIHQIAQRQEHARRPSGLQELRAEFLSFYQSSVSLYLSI